MVVICLSTAEALGKHRLHMHLALFHTLFLSPTAEESSASEWFYWHTRGKHITEKAKSLYDSDCALLLHYLLA